MFNKSEPITPITEARFILYIGDDRPSTYPPEDFIQHCVASAQDVYLCVNYNPSSEFYSIQSKASPSLIPFLSVFEILALCNEDEQDDSFDFNTLQLMTQMLFSQFTEARKDFDTIFTLCLPANLGVSSHTVVTEDSHSLIISLNVQDLILITNDSPDHEEDTRQYLSRKRNSTLGYRLPNTIESATQVSERQIEVAFAGKQDDRLTLSTVLKNRIIPATLERLPILSIYILSPLLARQDARLASMCSLNRKEAFICCTYHQQEDAYEVLQINSFPTKKQDRTSTTLTAVNIPKEKLAPRHFIQFIQGMRSKIYFDQFDFRLCIESGLGEENSLMVTPLTHRLIQTILPEYLHLITSLRNEADVKTYLMRQTSANGFLLPFKHMLGSYIPLKMILKLLNITRHRSSPILLSDHRLEDTSDDDSTTSIFNLQAYFDNNLIPPTALVLQNVNDSMKEARLSPLLPSVLDGSSNKAFRLFKEPPSAVVPEQLTFRDECGLRRVLTCPTLTELKACHRTVYLLTETKLFYYNALNEQLELIEMGARARLSLIPHFPKDVAILSPEQLSVIADIAQHRHLVRLASDTELEETACCQCVCC